jgi:CheY-like chemotaxis protein
MPHLSIVSVPPPDLSQWKILIVDDLSDNLQLMEIILKPTKAMVESTICPYKAVEKAGKGNYDLILVDLQMPEMDGYDTLRAAKAAGHKGQAWAVSAHAMKTDVIHCLQAGFSEHVSKPIQRNDFYKKLHAAKIARQI